MHKFEVDMDEKIAKICHDANRSYCECIGDNSQLPWETAPDWQRTSALKGVRFHLTALRSGTQPSPSASHESWLEEKRREGWKHGTVKNVAKKEHPCFMAFDKLPLEQQMKDYLFAGIVKSFYQAQHEKSLAA